MPKAVIHKERCKACELCIHFCPQKIIAQGNELNSMGYHPVVITEEDKCTGCARCALICPDIAIEIREYLPAKAGGGDDL